MDNIIELVTASALARDANISHAAAVRRLTRAAVIPDAVAMIGGSRGEQPLFLASRVPLLLCVLNHQPKEAIL